MAKSSSNGNSETSISIQIDLRQRQQEIKGRKSDIMIHQATNNNHETNYREIQKQMQTLTSELNHLKNNQNKETTFKVENRL